MKKLAVVLVLGVLAFLVLRWPRLNDVETGRTPEYPDLQVQAFAAGPEQVAAAAKEALDGLSRFRYVGSGSGPGGREIAAVATTRVLGFEDDLTIRIRREGGRTVVTVRSRSRVGAWDFGQNARNVREFQAALASRLPPGKS